MSSRNFFERNFLNCLIFFLSVNEKMAITLQLFLHEMLFNFFDGNFVEGCLVKIFAENVVMGNSVQIGPEFPAKSLEKIFLDAFQIYLIENYLTN